MQSLGPLKIQSLKSRSKALWHFCCRPDADVVAYTVAKRYTLVNVLVQLRRQALRWWATLSGLMTFSATSSFTLQRTQS